VLLSDVEGIRFFWRSDSPSVANHLRSFLMIDLILNGTGQGSVASALLDHEMDPNWLRPMRGRDGRPYVVQNEYNSQTEKRTKKNLCVANTGITAALRKGDWEHLDAAVLKAAKPRLRFVGDLRASGLTYIVPNGFGKSVLQYEGMSDTTPAEIAMDPYNETKTDSSVYDLTNLPLPIIHKDFWFTTRQIQMSRNSGTPLDTQGAEQASERVAEMAERLALGLTGTYKYGGGYVYGLTNFQQRLTKVMTNPETDLSWTPQKCLDEVLAMKEQSQLNYYYGPWMVYTSPRWDKYLDADYSAAKGDNTLRQRIKSIDGLQDVRTLDYLTGYQMILVQQTTSVVREVIGMEMTTVQWMPNPFRVNFKVLGIMVPQFRADINGNTGVVHGTAA